MTPAPHTDAALQRAFVVFCDDRGLWWLRWLRQGFRHCFVVLHDGRNWISVDPLSPHTEVEVLAVPPDHDLPGWFRSCGHAVVSAPVRRDHQRPAPLAPFSCVEAVKRVLGLHARWVITPWQLYRHLSRD